MKKRSSFFDRLSGGTQLTDDYEPYEDDLSHTPGRTVTPQAGRQPVMAPMPIEDDQTDGQLPVDVHQTPNEIVIRTFIAGVRPDEMNVSISRDMVVIEGSRDERDSVSDTDYFTRELFWGSFSRTILLPQEVDVENSSAGSKDGLLTIILPKLDKARQTKLRIKAG
ncbi:MAG: heat shock protein Hsp20, family protein [Parcubacteria group bacterium]|nr:heat shock protein Hsp20, family protein [Parcubacteria group bacterium]